MAILLNLLLSGATAFILSKIGFSLFNGNKWLTIIGTLGFLLHPIISQYQIGAIHPFSLDLLFACLLIYTGVCWNKITWKRAFIFSILIGLAILNRPTLVVFSIPFMYRMLTILKWKPLLWKGGVIVLIGILPIGMWMVRNHSIYDSWNLNSSYGQNLWIGIQEATEGTAQLPNGESYYSLMDDSTIAAINSLGPVEESNYFIQKYRQEIAEHPGKWSHMYLLKIKNFWWFRTSLGVDYGAHVTGYLIYYKIGYCIILILGLLGFLASNRVWRTVLISMLLLSLFQASFYVETRHRILIEPFLIISSLLAVQAIYNYFKTRNETGLQL
ncbi:MAG: hypothetical protein JKY54_13890 [Flavobacteriales bacterium]|nr:hypothetical protein [Flavobacteriales bacterium]